MAEPTWDAIKKGFEKVNKTAEQINGSGPKKHKYSIVPTEKVKPAKKAVTIWGQKTLEKKKKKPFFAIDGDMKIKFLQPLDTNLMSAYEHWRAEGSPASAPCPLCPPSGIEKKEKEFKTTGEILAAAVPDIVTKSEPTKSELKKPKKNLLKKAMDKNCLCNVHLAIPTFYVLEGLNTVIPKDSFKTSIVKLRQDFDAYRGWYNDNLARVLFDYLATSCFAEFRHTKKFSENKFLNKVIKEEVFPSGAALLTRQHAQKKSWKYSPQKFLPILSKYFKSKDVLWEDGYGGKPWAKIAKAALTYYEFPPEVFIDHVVDLGHNGGLCYDKGVLVQYNADSEDELEIYLTKKTKSCIFSKHHPCSKEVWDKFVQRALTFNLIKEKSPWYHKAWEDVMFQNENMVGWQLDRVVFPAPIKWGKGDISVI